MMTDVLPELVTCLALFVYVWNFVKVGQARGRHGIKAPAVTGNADFERVFRVQQNMVEQMVLFLPALWLFCRTISPIWGALLGVIWIGGRILYSATYYSAAEKRGPGFIIGMVSTLILLIGSFVGSLVILSGF
jgi:glutathione S-transferase